MEKILVGELKDYCKEHLVRKFLYCTRNQTWYNTSVRLKQELTFSTVETSRNPDIILLRQGDNVMYMDNVKYIKIEDKKSPLGIVLDVVCNSPASRGREIQYTLIAS